jgi:flagellar hook-length control protein FliK
MTPLMIGSAPSSGTGSSGTGSSGTGSAGAASAGVASTGSASTGSASTGSGSAAPDGTDSFASVLAATDPAPTSVAVSAATHGESGSARGSTGSTSGDRPADPASAAALAANFAVAALALPVPVPVPVTPAAASAWSGNRPAAGGSVTSVQSVAVASLSIEPAGQPGQPPTTAAPATTVTPATTAASATTATAATAVQTLATMSGQSSTGTAETPSTGTAGPAPSPAVAPAAAQSFVGGLRTIKPPTQPNTATAGSAQFAAPVASPMAAGTDRPAVTPVGGPDLVPVLVANPPVEQRPSAPNKPITPVVTHDPAGPVLASHPLPRPNNDSGTGSNDREHPSNPQPGITPASSTGFNPTDPNQPTLAASQPVVASQPVTASQPISQPATAQSAPADPLPVSHQLSGPVLSLRTAGNGSHQLTIALHPAELGPVNLHVRIVGDSMAIQLASTSEGAHDALREALPQLRQELQAAGLGNVDLSLDLGGAPSGNHAQAGNHTQAGSRQPEAGYQTEQPIRTAPRRSTATESGLDRWL